MLQKISAVIAGLRRLIERREGSLAVIFALCAIPVFIAAGMAIDIGRAYAVKVRLGAALDAAALAVGSEANSQTQAQLGTDLQNYFTANYPSTALGTPSAVTPVPANASLTASTVNYQVQATVPMTLMRLIGVNSVTVTATAQTKKTTGLEIAIVLDNTGSMLCGPNDGAPSYSNSTCTTGVVASDTTCTNSSNGSRICTLINAAKQFVNTLTSAISSAQQLYISVVPYVTSVNVGNALCTGASSCSNIATNGGDFTDLRGNIMPVTPITGTTTSGSTTISNVSMLTPGGSVSGTAAIQQGMYIYGHGIPANATVSSVNSSSIVISSAAALTFAGNSLAVGPTSGNTTSPGYTDPTTYSATATTSTSSTTITLATGTTTNNIVAGMAVTSSTTGVIGSGTTVATVVSATQITLSAKPSKTEATAVPLIFSLAGTTASNTTVSGLAGSTASLSSIVVGMTVTDSSGKIPANTYVTSVNTSAKTLMLSASATGAATGDALTFTNLGATTTAGNTAVTGVYFNALPSVGNVIVGNGIPANTTITAVTGNAAQFAAGTGSLTISQSATTPSNFSSATDCCNTALAAFSPLTYDSTYNSASPAGSSTTQNWGGCVTEPTSSDENSSGTGVLNASLTDPDYNEPSSSLQWYPQWWAHDSTNNWTPTTVNAQDTSTETQGKVVTDWLGLDGPNQGCPVPMIPLTDATTTAGQTTILNTIGSMWPRDAGGTQVHIGMIWGWRALSPNGPFASNNGHPLSYSSASSTAWKKVVVLMTDGTEEWPSAGNMTGLGQITDGKIGTTSTTTAVSNLNTRLADVCSNMAASGNFVIYTIGLGSDGGSNTDLQNCPGSTGGFFEAATTSNLQAVFQNIAKSLLALRLSQ